MIQQLHSRYVLKRNENTCLHKILYINVYSNIIHSSQKVLKQAKCASMDEQLSEIYIRTKEYYLGTKRVKYQYMLRLG